MKCPKCQFDNREGVKFCEGCGAKMKLQCPHCQAEIPLGRNFCGECGQALNACPSGVKAPKMEGQRKHVTVLFSDLSGYTSISEKLDPEELKEMMGIIFGEISRVVEKYEGFIEKYIGDAVMAVFGLPKSHEDDPVRAIKVALEIHEVTAALSPKIFGRIGQGLAMHTGIDTGLVVTGTLDREKGTLGITGDTLNLASRLSSLANEDEIFVGLNTYRLAEGYFTFERLEPTPIKGKSKPVQVYRVLSAREKPVTLHRLSGLKADLIGRKAEIVQLNEAMSRLDEGKGMVFSICGGAGTGKSRLVEEFKKSLNLKNILWLEGHAYAYSQNFPYFPLVDLLNRAFEIKEGDPPEAVRKKIETNIHGLIGKEEEIISCVGSLYALEQIESDQRDPEYWKSSLRQSIRKIFAALAQAYTAVICFEDLHWADESSLDLLRFILSDIRPSVLFICIFRTDFSLFSTEQVKALGDSYQEIRLEDLSASETQEMVESLLKTDSLPSDLRHLVQENTGGNPFYLEELINALIEVESLTRVEDSWRMSRSIFDSGIPSTINGLISARIDRLDGESRRLLREASVIGRAFLYEILKRITEIRDRIDQCLKFLEQVDFIRTKSLLPELEYIFKHALIQEVIYNGLLLKERQEIHKRIALVIEEVFAPRLSEFYETLAFHFEKGNSAQKAIQYLIKSGEKSLNRYAVEESHQYFKKAFEKLKGEPRPDGKADERIIDLLVKWAFVFHYRGDFRGLRELLSAHEVMAKSLDDKQGLGMLYSQLGLAHYQTESLKASYKYLQMALELGEKAKNDRVVGYACSHLTWVCSELGLMEDALGFGKRGVDISTKLQSDEFLYFNSLGGIGLGYFYKGDRKMVLKVGRDLLDYAGTRTNIRSLVLGHFFLGCSHIIAGDFSSSISSLQEAIKSSVDPWFSQFPRLLLGFSYLSKGLYEEAKASTEDIFDYSVRFGTDLIKTPARILEGILKVTEGDLRHGLKILEKTQQENLDNARMYVYASAEDMIGRIYLQVLEGAKGNLPVLKNIGFLIRDVPLAARKAEKHFQNAIKISEQIGATGIMGIASLDLGRVYHAKGRKDEACNYISKAITCFKGCDAEAYLKEAEEAISFIQ